jgi:hypothetical protein
MAFSGSKNTISVSIPVARRCAGGRQFTEAIGTYPTLAADEPACNALPSARRTPTPGQCARVRPSTRIAVAETRFGAPWWEKIRENISVDQLPTLAVVRHPDEILVREWQATRNGRHAQSLHDGCCQHHVEARTLGSDRGHARPRPKLVQTRPSRDGLRHRKPRSITDARASSASSWLRVARASS